MFDPFPSLCLLVVGELVGGQSSIPSLLPYTHVATNPVRKTAVMAGYIDTFLLSFLTKVKK